MGRAVLQYSHCISDMTRRRWSGRAGGAWRRQTLGAGRRVGHCKGARGMRQGRAAWEYCWVVCCVLGALSLFLTRFDSVLFLSQFLDTVHEPGS